MSKFKAIFGGGGGAPAIVIPPPPPIPTREDPAIAAKARKDKEAEKRRRGRKASFLTAGQQASGALGDTPVDRPELSKTKLLGG